jgi:glycosyltransferase involved in cell wall biosynthesis
MRSDRTELGVSVVIAAYNSEAFIAEALESVLSQSMPPKEVIVVDDLSTDGTRDVVRSIAASAPIAVRLVELLVNSGGPAAPLNAGVAAASQECIVFLDHDDRMAPTKVEIATRLLERHAAAGICFGQMRPMSDPGGLLADIDQRYAHYPSEAFCMGAREAFHDLIDKGFLYGGAGGMAIRKRTWQTVGPFRTDLRIAWDFDFALRAVLANWDVAYTPETVFYHRLHAGNLERVNEGVTAVREITELFVSCIEEPSLSRSERRAVRAAAGRVLLRAGYRHRATGHYAAALAYYLRAMRKAYLVRRPLVGMVKVLLTPAREAMRVRYASAVREASRQ